MCTRNRAPNMRELLGEHMNIFVIVYFLKNIGAYDLIYI